MSPFSVFMASAVVLAMLLPAVLFQVQGATQTSGDVHGISTKEFNALYALYNSTDGENWTWPPYHRGPNNGLHWNFTEDANPCNPGWYGIKCTGGTNLSIYSISSITLTVLNLTGTLPIALGDFPALETLQLRNNPKLIGPIPDVFGNLTQLRVLHLSRNSLTGSVPLSIGKNVLLESLSMFDNVLNGTLPADICNLRVLSEVNFADNYFNGTIPTCFSQLSEINTLNFSRNTFSGPIPPWLVDLNKLVTIDFLVNQFTGVIPESIGQLHYLSHLAIGENSLSGTLPMSLCILTDLSGLYMSNSGLSGLLPNCLSQLTSLDTFEADNNLFSGTLPSNIMSMPRLRYFSCRNNHLQGTIPHLFGRFVHLIWLAGNKFTGPLPVSIFGLPLLTALNVSNNYLTGTIPGFNRSTLALSLDLGVNYFTGTFPASLGNSSALQFILMDNNLLHGRIPSSLQHLRLLQELNVEANFFSGSIHFINSSIHDKLNTLLLSNNQLTGQIPDDVFQLRQLKVFSAVSNCFYTRLTEAMCASDTLVTIALDGMRSGRSCRSVLLGQTGAYYVKNALVQKIPDCLFQMNFLTTLHLSGNGLTGQLPANITISSILRDLSLSHNRLSGTIPENFQVKPWVSLDLSYNRYTGSLLSMFGYNNSQSNARGKLSLENNRLSGQIPNTLQQVRQISILGSNIFGCTNERTDLPRADPGRSTYHCGSNSFEAPYYSWLVLTGACIAVLIWSLFYTGSNTFAVKPTLLVEKLQRYVSFVQTANLGGSAPSLQSVMFLCDNIGMLSAAVLALTVIVLVPLYLAVAGPYGTYSHQYAWQVSASMLSGRIIAAVLMVLWLLLMCVVIAVSYYYQRRADTHREAQKQQNRSSRSDRDSRAVSLSLVVLSWFERCMLYGLFMLISICVVVGVNILYVYVVLYKHRKVVVLVQILMAFFKLFWSNFCSRELMHWTARQISKSIETTESVYGREFHLVQLLVSLLNNVVIPCIVVAVVSPNCFYNVFVPPPTVRANYVYSKCAYNSIIDGGCRAYEEAVGDTSYNPPFIYNYECSSSIITYYAPAFVFLCITATFATPLSQLLCLHASRIETLPEWMRTGFEYFVPRIMKPVDPTQAPPVNSRNPYFDANRAVILLFSYLGMLLTFGVVFPPLAAAFTVTIFSTIYFIKITMGSFIASAIRLKAEHYIKLLNLACERMAQLAVLGPSVWLIVTFSCFFYTLFLFDTMGNAVGYSEAYWVLIVMPLMPFCLYIVYRCVVMYIERNDNAVEQPVVTETTTSPLGGRESTDVQVEMTEMYPNDL